MIYTFTNTDIQTLTGYISGIVGDMMPLILIVLGITIGLYVFNKITK